MADEGHPSSPAPMLPTATGSPGREIPGALLMGPLERNSMPSMLPGLPPREREVGEEGRSALASVCNLDNFKKFQGLNLDE